jgi:V/A-type H+/Na+-transporting ATPase subunit E
MEVDLQGLIEKIKSEGIEKAKEEAAGIISKAKEEAAGIISKAKEESEEIKKTGHRQAEAKQAKAEKAVNQAVRDVILNVRQKIQAIFDRVLKEQVSQSLSPENMAQIIKSFVDSWKEDKKQGLEVLINKQDKDKLKAALFSGVKKEAQKEIDIKITQNINKGFRVGLKGEHTHYDFSDESITEALKEFLSPEIREMLDSKDE